ncbi:glycerate kinase [Vibrio sp. SCSIO 43137]|uniref:glycerate kinase n=1 Tax=Vibrio sp. SCSIO 43137 TaxID=3021011 RepID=UPI002307CB25|nr:glycerate kinase [Vibrio sp. SCSIO 43137]WCE29098.1 glycerate kinase [Vibrio sp. SCSIO 43137]
MKVVIAPDSFKESLSAKEVCQSIENGLRRVWQDAEILHVPVADGGEGTVQSLVDATAGHLVELQVQGPLDEKVDAFYGILGDGKTAAIEMAAASGLHHVIPEKRDPKLTSSFGTGELIRHALDNGINRLVIGLGGSATNDGGIGMLTALGARFLDSYANPVTANGAGLNQVDSIDVSALDSRLAECEIMIACDVDNPLCGASGASATFGPQKGATEADINLLDAGLKNLAAKVQQQLNRNILDVPGAGAAGGMGGAFLGFTDGRLKPGIDIVVETVGLEEKVIGADLVITGEGRIDWQTAHGKTPMGVAQAAKKYSIPVIAIAGCVGDDYQAVYKCGIDAVFTALPRPMDLPAAFAEASVNLANQAENIARTWSVANR